MDVKIEAAREMSPCVLYVSHIEALQESAGEDEGTSLPLLLTLPV